MKWLPELLLGAALLAAAGLLAAPRRPLRGFPAAIPAAASTHAERQPASAAASGHKPLAPAQIASLFGWAAPAAPRGPAAAAKPTEAPWLKPVGFVIGEDGAGRYVFKDTRSKAVLTLARGVQNRGWVLKDVREGEFLLVYDGMEYVVRRNE